MATNASTINYVVGEPIPTHRRAFPRRAPRTCSAPKHDRNCMECGNAIYQGVLCAECHSKASNNSITGGEAVP